MATSRTGTSEWLAVVAYVRREAQRNGLEYCPSCGVRLDWVKGRRLPNSAEVDHIVPHSKGGTDTVDNARILCRRCNQSKGANQAPKPRVIQAVTPLKVSRQH